MLLDTHVPPGQADSLSIYLDYLSVSIITRDVCTGRVCLEVLETMHSELEALNLRKDLSMPWRDVQDVGILSRSWRVDGRPLDSMD